MLVCDGEVIHGHHLPPTLQTAEASGTVTRRVARATPSAAYEKRPDPGRAQDARAATAPRRRACSTRPSGSSTTRSASTASTPPASAEREATRWPTTLPVLHAPAADPHRNRRRRGTRAGALRRGAGRGRARAARRDDDRRAVREARDRALRPDRLRRPRQQPAERHPAARARRRGEGRLRRRAGEGGARAGAGGEGRPEEARGLHAGRPRFREPVHARGPRPRLRRDALELCTWPWPSRPCRAGPTSAARCPAP